ncbi:hypothetical protein DAETH_48650 (plasmid) [Deinococcus aetherius]|uniref:Uncharacterized protein n=1 Tax=Deinococcus aetherius TaxID=200252 RepID=A0ABN6RNL7_9DEIO|nr:hypothetical protein [Deinococcus aetherius]BDP44896.1 hypothetical protein DAETH_48650 [Deinococcus aetherius]
MSHDWFWVYHCRNGEVLAWGHADHNTRADMTMSQYRGYPLRLVRGPVGVGRPLSTEQMRSSYKTVCHALRALASAGKGQT